MRVGSRTIIRLDGAWGFRLDPRNDGITEGWQHARHPSAHSIQVPSVWEETHPGYDGVAWYWEDVHAATGSVLEGERWLLRFAAVNHRATVWLNGVECGSHDGGYTPFEVDVTAAMRPGTNLLAVRVVAPPQSGEPVDGLKLTEVPCWREKESFAFGGIWQCVELHRTPTVRLNDLFVQPDIVHGVARLQIETINEQDPTAVELTVRLRDPDGAVTEITWEAEAPTGLGLHDIDVRPQSGLVLWSPDTPRLYSAEVAVRTPDGDDTIDTRFGFREFTFDEGEFRLNGERMFVKGGFHEGLYPIGIARPIDERIVREELEAARRAGFNLLRYWQIPPHPRVSAMADELGIMLMAEPPLEWLAESAELTTRCQREVRELVRRDRNHPSIVIWGVLNESAILPSDGRPPGAFSLDEWSSSHIQALRADLCQLVRELDPTRVIIDDSGGFVSGANLYPPRCGHSIPLNDIHLYRRAPVSRATYNELRSLGESPEWTVPLDTTITPELMEVPGGAGWTALPATPVEPGPVFVTEFGYGGLPELTSLLEIYDAAGASPTLEDYSQLRALRDDLRRVLQEQGLEDVFSTEDELARASQQVQAHGNARQIEALRENPRLVGYILHAFVAGGLIIGAGVLDPWRRPKLAATMLQELHQPTQVLMDASPPVVETGHALILRALVVAESLTGASGSLRIVGPDGTLLQEEQVTVNVPVSSPLSVTVRPGQPPGSSHYKAEFVTAGERYTTTRELLVLPEPDWSTVGAPVTVVSPPGDLRAALHLSTRGVAIEEGADLAKARTVVVTAPAGTWGEGRVREQLEAASQAARDGATVAFLSPLTPRDLQVAQRWLPGLKEIRASTGEWAPVAHWVRPHRFLDELPAPGLMDWPFAEVCPRYALIDNTDAETVCGSIGLRGELLRKPTEMWAGRTLLVRRFGLGRLVFSQLELPRNLGKDAVADRLTYNLLRWAREVSSQPS